MVENKLFSFWNKARINDTWYNEIRLWRKIKPWRACPRKFGAPPGFFCRIGVSGWTFRTIIADPTALIFAELHGRCRSVYTPASPAWSGFWTKVQPSPVWCSFSRCGNLFSAPLDQKAAVYPLVDPAPGAATFFATGWPAELSTASELPKPNL